MLHRLLSQRMMMTMCSLAVHHNNCSPVSAYQCGCSDCQRRSASGAAGQSAATVGLVLHHNCCTGFFHQRCRCQRFMTSSAVMHAAACSTCIAHGSLQKASCQVCKQFLVSCQGWHLQLLSPALSLHLSAGWNHTLSPSAYHLNTARADMQKAIMVMNLRMREHAQLCASRQHIKTSF